MAHVRWYVICMCTLQVYMFHSQMLCWVLLQSLKSNDNTNSSLHSPSVNHFNLKCILFSLLFLPLICPSVAAPSSILSFIGPSLRAFLLVWPPFHSLWLAAGAFDTRASLTGKIWQASPSFLSHHLLSGHRVSQGPLTHTHWRNPQTDKYSLLKVWELLQGLFAPVTQMFLLAPLQVLPGWLGRP